MSRIAKAPINIPKGIEVKFNGNNMTVKGAKGQLSFDFNPKVGFSLDNDVVQLQWDKNDKNATAQAGTARAIANGMIIGVSDGFEKKLTLIGVGYRAQAKGNTLSLSLGYTHPVEFVIPDGLTIDTPTQTEIIIKGSNKQLIGEVAAKIRRYRPPEPYKGKGVRYSDENVAKKEAKKK